MFMTSSKPSSSFHRGARLRQRRTRPRRLDWALPLGQLLALGNYFIPLGLQGLDQKLPKVPSSSTIQRLEFLSLEISTVIAPKWGTEVMAGTEGHFQPGFFINFEFQESSDSNIWTCILDTWRGQRTHEEKYRKHPFPDQQPLSHRLTISLGYLSCGHTCHTSERRVKIIKEHKQNADRTEKEIFGIFGVINTIKITNGKSQWGSLLWFSLEIESFSFFFFFLFSAFFFFFFVCCFTHTQSSFLEAASVRVSFCCSDFFFLPVSVQKPRNPGWWAGSRHAFSECTGSGWIVIACPQTLLCCPSDSKQTAVLSVVLNTKYKLYRAPFADAE